MTTRRSPLGYLIEDRPEGLFLHKAHDLWEARMQVQKETSTYIEGRENGVRVFLSRDADQAGPDHHDEWGAGPDYDTAWRYALGAYFGSHEDPEVEWDPLLNESS